MIQTRSSRILDRIIIWSLDYPLSPTARYLAATLVVLVVGVARATFITSLLPWLLFIPAVLLIVLILGEGPGMWAGLVATVLAAVTIGSRGERAWLTGAQWGASALFLLVALGVARITGEVRAAFHRTQMLMNQLAERESFLSGVLASSTDCIKVLDLDGRLTFMSEGGMKIMEINDFTTVEGCPWPGFWQDAGNGDAIAAIVAARNGQTSHFVGKADTLEGNSRWWDVSVSPIPGRDGRPERILSVSRDATALLNAQEQQRLLNGELGHRLKNVLALVQSIANQTFRQADSMTDASAAFAARLAALGKATDVLTVTSWQTATLRAVASAGLTSVDGLAERVFVDGPEVILSSQVALALTLTLHELTTNACKYGALSNDTGSVQLTWENEAGENHGPDCFTLLWQEVGGPPVVKPVRQGFGSKMIERSLRSYFRGETSLIFDPTGVIFRIGAPPSETSTNQDK
ncbi:HWE histidine kinase domain-containing protein [Sphingomonas sp. UYEF23]|uniref:HWE histidine kinase domain-containing protein n=1 Tax=Sphingomonas sp. UYEF23 TaxID=1756408 RepID=UPI003392AE75